MRVGLIPHTEQLLLLRHNILRALLR